MTRLSMRLIFLKLGPEPQQHTQVISEEYHDRQDRMLHLNLKVSG